MNHSTSKRTAKALPQVESTILVEGITAPIVKCTANKAFTVGNSHIKTGETFFLVKSERRAGRYYVVHFDGNQNRPQCSCGANHKDHAHITAYKSYIQEHVVNAKSEKVAATSESVDEKTEQEEVSSNEVIEAPHKLTADDWKEIMRKDKARQKAEKAADWAKIEEARKQAKEASIA